MVSIADFQKIDIKVGEIVSAEKVPDTDKLLKLSVNVGLKPVLFKDAGSPEHSAKQNVLGEEKLGQIISGIAEHFPDPQTLVGKKVAFVTNLEPRIIRGLESQGMILAVSSENGVFSLLETNNSIMPGSRVK